MSLIVLLYLLSPNNVAAIAANLGVLYSVVFTSTKTSIGLNGWIPIYSPKHGEHILDCISPNDVTLRRQYRHIR